MRSWCSSIRAAAREKTARQAESDEGLHLAARIAAAAQPGEVLVSSTVKDLVAGSGLDFEDRGVHELKGIPGEWRLYAAV